MGCKNSLIPKYSVLLFVGFCIASYFFNSIHKFNQDIFVFGSLAYLVVFIIVSINNLKEEDLDFFTSNNFILISSPLLFFLGMALIFGFKNKELNNQDVLGMKFYELVNLFGNITYYSLVNLYIYKEFKQKNAT
ncbi:hypothetical protein [Flavobacterium wongokense]|uniref:hypothetical protein n=1 Tax=Flavobacterium wongokense TaxID=2910674 RepID=UPI001F2737D9|nr:hypothetical protein [Flavobacterium sp. WG47]MCF6130939.1 hypothetical protein [Flavobacterium sp. WG47]